MSENPPNAHLPRPNPAQTPRRRMQPALLWGFIILILGGMIIAWNYAMRQKFGTEGERIPYAQNLRGRNLQLLRSDGKEISLFEIADQGKPWVLGTIYTSCPRQCSGVAEELRRIEKEVGEGKVNFVLVSFDPTRDRPVVLQSWARAHDLEHPDWYLLTATDDMEEEILLDYLEEPLKLWRPVWRLKADGSRDPSQEPEHPLNVIVLTGQDLRESYTLGVNEANPVERVRESSARMVKTLRTLVDEKR